MSPGEVRARSVRTARHRLDDLAWRRARGRWRRSWEPDDRQLLASARTPAPIGFLRGDRAELLRSRAPGEAECLVAAAERALAGRVRYFGYDEVQLVLPVDYARDGLTDRRWPDRHGKAIDYRHADVGDPKWVWELNRLQHLPLLAEAWLLTGERRFADAAARELAAWTSGSAPGRGIAWSNGFEAGIRAISLSLTLDALRGSGALSWEDERLALRSLWQHGRWIVRDPSTHSSANNHLLGELVGLLALALLAPELRDSPGWERLALDELAREVERQILPDGVGAELAFLYHAFVLDLLLVAVALLDCTGRDVPAAIVAALRRSADALSAQLGEGEPAPTYGDADDGRAALLDGQELLDARGLASALAARLGHAGARRAAGSLDARALWLFGQKGAERFDLTLPEDPQVSMVLPDGGLVILRAPGRRAIVDVGPLGYLSIAAHGHADALSLTLVDDGEELVVDPGVGSYFGRPERRRGFRGTAFHPTVTVDGLDQSEPGGPFLWRRHARTRLRHLDLEAGVVVAEHDGYERLPDPVRHRRAVHVPPEGPLVVLDSLEGSAAHAYAQVWPLHPGLEAEADGPRTVRVARGDEPRLLIALECSRRGELTLVRGEEEPFAGWWSPRLESVQPAWFCAWGALAAGPIELVALLWPLRGNEVWPEPELTVTREGGETVVAYTTPVGRHTVEFSLEAPEPVRSSIAATQPLEGAAL